MFDRKLYDQRWRRTPRGLLSRMYHSQKHNSPKRGFPPPVYTKDELLDRYLNNPKYLSLFEAWKKAGYPMRLTPSIDRISNRLPYSFDNIHLVTWGENRFKQTMERRRRKGPVLQVKDGIVVGRYPSQREAVKATGIYQSGISDVLAGRQDTAGGYFWRWEREEDYD